MAGWMWSLTMHVVCSSSPVLEPISVLGTAEALDKYVCLINLHKARYADKALPSLADQ